MTEEDIHRHIDSLNELSMKSQEIKSQSMQAIHYLKGLSQIIRNIWQEGYDDGFEQGKLHWVKKDLNSN